MLRAEGLGPTRESPNIQPLELRFRALLEEGTSEVQLSLGVGGEGLSPIRESRAEQWPLGATSARGGST